MARIVAVSLIAIAMLAQAQEPAAITLNVVATDSKGNHIRSLTGDDFEILSRGKTIEVSDVSERALTPRRIAVIFDVTSISLAARRTMIDGLRDFLSKSLRPGDRVLLLTAGQALTPLSEWTADSAQIDAALQRAGTESSATMAGDRESAERRIREMITDIQQARQTLYTFDTILETVRTYATAVYRDTKQSIGLLNTATNLFSSRSTRNVMIVVGAGLPLRAGADLFQYLDNVKSDAERGQLGGALRQGAGRSSPLTESSSFDLTPFLKAVAAEARDRGVAIYTIDSEMAEAASARVEANRMSDRTASFATIANRSAGYQLLADESGGVAFLAQRPNEALAQIRSDLDSYYSIVLHPTSPLAANDPVEVRSKSAPKIRTARGGAPLTADAEVQSRVVAYHLMKPDANDLGISVQAAPPVADGDKRRVNLKVMIPIKNLRFVQEGNVVTGGFTVYITTGDALGHTSSVNKQTQQLRWPVEALQAAGDRKVTFAVDVVLEAGRTQISVGVLDLRSETTGYDRVSV